MYYMPDFFMIKRHTKKEGVDWTYRKKRNLPYTNYGVICVLFWQSPPCKSLNLSGGRGLELV